MLGVYLCCKHYIQFGFFLSPQDKLLCKASTELTKSLYCLQFSSGQRLLCHPRATSCTRVPPDPEFCPGCPILHIQIWPGALRVPPCGAAHVSPVPRGNSWWTPPAQHHLGVLCWYSAQDGRSYSWSSHTSVLNSPGLCLEHSGAELSNLSFFSRVTTASCYLFWSEF